MMERLLAADPLLVQLPALLIAGCILHLSLRLILRRAHRLAGTSAGRWDDVVVTALEAPLRSVLWAVIVYLALDLFLDGKDLTLWLGYAYDTAIVILVAWFLHRLIRGVQTELLSGNAGPNDSRDKASVHAVAQLLRILLWVLTGLMVLQTVGVSVSGLLAFGGIGGIAVGFAAKDLLANFFGGMSIYLDRPFTVGDWIRSPDRELEGTVENIGWRLTTIRTFSQRPLYVPNAIFSQVAIENPSRMRNRRIYETIGIRYQDAGSMATIVDQVRLMLLHHTEIDTSRTLIVNFVSFGASSLDFFIYTFTKTTDWVKFHEIKQDVMIQVLEIIHANSADVAYPTQTLHLNPMTEEPE